jgi:thioesterase domain-containing protein
VHPVSGSPYVYAGLARLLEEDRPVWGFEAPGYDDDREPLTSFDALAAEYLPALRRDRPGGPYLLLGWSLGGSLAFYLAQQLAASGAPVPVLVLVDATVPFRSPLPVEREMLRKFLHDLLALGGLPAAGLDEIVARFPAEVPPERLFAEVERSGLLPEDADADFLDYRYSVFRAHIGALYDFEPAGGYDGPVTVVRASGTDPAYMHWERVAGRVTEHTVQGDHHSIWSGAGLLHLAQIVQQTLDAGGQ